MNYTDVEPLIEVAMFLHRGGPVVFRPPTEEEKKLTQPCPIRGHDHSLTIHEVVVQDGTGMKLFIWECPSGYYRWHQVEGNEFTDRLRLKRPHWGWKD